MSDAPSEHGDLAVSGSHATLPPRASMSSMGGHQAHLLRVAVAASVLVHLAVFGAWVVWPESTTARVDLDEVVTVKVHLSFVGQPEAAKKPGAIVTHDMPEIEVSCKVRDIPEEIKIDLSAMQGETLSVSHLKLPAGVTAASDANAAVIRVQFMKEAAEGEAAAPAAAAAPEVTTAKKEEGGAAKK